MPAACTTGRNEGKVELCVSRQCVQLDVGPKTGMVKIRVLPSLIRHLVSIWFLSFAWWLQAVICLPKMRGPLPSGDHPPAGNLFSHCFPNPEALFIAKAYCHPKDLTEAARVWRWADVPINLHKLSMTGSKGTLAGCMGVEKQPVAA